METPFSIGKNGEFEISRKDLQGDDEYNGNPSFFFYPFMIT